MTNDVLTHLSFGTDGWRDLIADKFTFDNLERAAQGYADTLLAAGGSFVLVGHDTRFMGRDFSKTVARVLAGNGLRVQVSHDYLPTPALSFATRHLGADGAVMLTASHNPFRFQGFKLKGRYGGSALEQFYQDVANQVNLTAATDVKRSLSEIDYFDIRQDYYAGLQSLVDVPLLEQATGTVIHDAMGGAAAGWLKDWFDYTGLEVQLLEFRHRPDPLFYGVNPEPIGLNLHATQKLAMEHTPLFATATDGDGDRLGVVLPSGEFFNSHQIFAVLLMHLHARGNRGRVVKTFTVSRLIERLAKALDLEVLETPVGFKYIAEAMLQGDVLIGGEESGGLGVGGHIPERDGILNSLLLLEAVIHSGKGLAELFHDAEKLAGWQHAYDRLDLQLSDHKQQNKVLTALQADLLEFVGRTVESVERLDGVKLNLVGDSWVLFRASGTEPVLRIYCEAATDSEVKDILSASETWVQSLIGATE